MKTVKLAGLVLALCASCLVAPTAFANDGDESQRSALRDMVTKLLKAPNLADHGINYEEVRLKFMLNGKREIVVVSTNADSPYLDAFLKQRLNYKRVKDESFKQGVYNMSITFKTD